MMRSIMKTGLVLLVAGCACLDVSSSTDPALVFSSSLTVDTSYTPGPQPGDFYNGEYPVFVLRWTSVENADHYVVRILDEPVDQDNWDLAVPVDTVAGANDTCWVSLDPVVYSNTCIGCGICVDVCPQDAITLIDGRAVIDPAICTSCGQCVLNCPVKAISDTHLGKFYYFAIRAYSTAGIPSEQVVSTSNAYRMIYRNFEPYCLRCPGNPPEYESGCFAVRNTPPCPVDAIYWDEDWLIHIDLTKCIYCGWCFKHCNGLTPDQFAGAHTISLFVEALIP
jgi:ferredoxin